MWASVASFNQSITPCTLHTNRGRRVVHLLSCFCLFKWHFGLDRKESACNTGDPGSIPVLLNISLNITISFLPLTSTDDFWKLSQEGQLTWSSVVLWRRQWHPTPVHLPGESHGWRSLVGCSPWGRWGSDTTERLHFTRLNPWVRKILWRREWLPTPGFLPGKLHGQKSLAGYSPWAAKSQTRLQWRSLSLIRLYLKSWDVQVPETGKAPASLPFLRNITVHVWETERGERIL